VAKDSHNKIKNNITPTRVTYDPKLEILFQV